MQSYCIEPEILSFEHSLMKSQNKNLDQSPTSGRKAFENTGKFIHMVPQNKEFLVAKDEFNSSAVVSLLDKRSNALHKYNEFKN